VIFLATENKKIKKQSSDKKNHVASKSEAKKKKQSNKKLIIVGVIIVVVAIAAIVLFNILKPKAQEVPNIYAEYNGYFFNKTGNSSLWSVVVRTQKGDANLEFYFHPLDVENYTYNVNITRDVARLIILKGKFYIGYDVGLSDKGVAAIAGSEVSRITGKIFGLETKSGFIDAVSDKTIPVINCSMVNSTTMVLEFRLGNETKIAYDTRNCIVIYASNLEDTVKMADFLDYNLLGVIRARDNSPKNVSAANSTSPNSSIINKTNISN
jgi:hypothetical protein